MKLNSIWDWELWHKIKGTSNIIKDKPDFIKKMNEKSTDKKSEKKDNDNDEKDKTV
jgi:hypothetical protein